ncbi:MAG: shikimate dehydrogenase [Gallionellales bacterium RIFCSPLOWO2_02_FULL_57_47]|nr:MAG: shikimate dehydrogenase [Gallionellales bacterium RIFCSPLOWO2_02_FULL_57_47]OGT15554.1 MAG: shikimate dehydrogenase [Gallionellales bacterium RIFCSPHIGHO2_02_FULL_57_16]
MTDKYAVIGNPIDHSKSPQIHKMFAQQTGQDISYEAIEAPLEEGGFKDKVIQLRDKGYRGCNVTVPFKFEAFKLAAVLSERAQVAQAVNTLKFDGATILGDNTDGAGLVRDIQQNLKFSLQGRDILLLGAGGAAWGVSLPLLEAEANINIFNRTTDKAQQLSHGLQVFLKRDLYTRKGLKFGLPNFVNSYAELSSKQFDFVINATSAGLTGSEIPLPPTIFAPGALAYDMMYGRETPFMKFAREHGAQVADGLGMLVEQAAESFYIWRGIRPDTAPVIAVLRTAK